MNENKRKIIIYSVLGLLLDMSMILALLVFLNKKLSFYYFIIPAAIVIIKEMYLTKKYGRRKYRLIDVLSLFVFFVFSNLYFETKEIIYFIIMIISFVILFFRENNFFYIEKLRKSI